MKGLFSKIFILSIALLLAMSVSEFVLRRSGYTPWKLLPNFDHVPVMTEPNEQLGWVNKPGHYVYSPTADGKNEVSVTVNSERRREPSANSLTSDIWVFGCSFSFGWALNDGEEYPAQLQNLISPKKVANFAVPGYGTLQSLESFKRQVALNGGKGPSTVVYGFISFHDERNIASADWLRTIRRSGRTQNWVNTPYATLSDSGSIVYHQPTRYLLFPGASTFALMAQAQEGWMQLTALTRERDQRKQDVTLALLEEWKKVTEAAGSRLVVLTLFLPGDRYYYLNEFRKHHIEVVDGSENDMPAPGSLVPGDNGHPVAAIHTMWANRLAKFLSGPKDTSASAWTDISVQSGKLKIDGSELTPRGNMPGYIESIDRQAKYIELVGWAVDPEASSGPLTIVATLDNTILEIGFTKFPRPDVLAVLKLQNDAKPEYKLRVSNRFVASGGLLHAYVVSNGSFRELPCVGDCRVTPFK